MKFTDLIKYTDQIYGWSIKRTGNHYEAEDLSQQIMLEAFSSIGKLRDEKAFYGWLWALANNIYKRWSYSRHRYSYYNLNITEINAITNDEIDSALINDENKTEIKKEISILSYSWREIIVLYYFDEKSIGEISKKTGLSEGTVKWRLHEARKKIKKEIAAMNEHTYIDIKPIKLKVITMGKALDKKPDMMHPLPPLPHSYVQNAVAQNIAAATYEKPITIEEISKCTGIPAYYIEEEMKLLIENELMLKKSNKYQANFVIVRKALNDEIHNALLDCSNSISERLLNSINSLEKEIRTIGFYESNKNFKDLLWTLIPFTFRECENDIFKSTLDCINLLPKRSTGGNWNVYGFEESDHPQYSLGQYLCPDEAETYFFNMYFWDGMEFNTRRNLKLQQEHVNVISKLLDSQASNWNFTADEKEIIAELIQVGYITRTFEGFSLNIISMTNAQYNMLKEVLSKTLKLFKNELIDLKEKITDILKCASPKHLSPQLDFLINYLFSDIGAYIIKDALDKGILSEPIDFKTTGAFIFKRDK